MALNGSCISSHKGSRLVKKCLTIGNIKRNRASLLAAETASAIWKAQNLFGPTSAMQHTPGNYRHNHLRSFRNPFKKTCKGLLLPSASVSSKICPTTTSKIRSCAFICNMFFGTKSSSPQEIKSASPNWTPPKEGRVNGKKNTVMYSHEN